MSRQSILTIVATLVVLIIAVAMFALAGQPITQESEIAQSWITALCAGATDELYGLSAVPSTMSRDQFEARVQEYRNSGEIPNPCTGQVNFNLVRTVPVPSSLRPQVTEISFFSEAILRGSDSQQRSIPLWLYHQVDGQWRVWSSFLGSTPETPTLPGEIASLLDTNGLMVGTVQVESPVVVYQAANDTLIGIRLNLQSFSRPWEQYHAQLFSGHRQAREIDQPEQLAAEWRADFLPTSGGYAPQNLQWTGTMWFRIAALSDSLVLAFNATVPFSGTLQSTYFTIPETEVSPLMPFNPFSEGRFVDIVNVNPVFEFSIDTARLPMNQMMLRCSDFVLITTDDEWRRGTDCTFPEFGEHIFLPNEHMSLQVTFAGYQIASVERIKSVLYRRASDNLTFSYVLWEAST